MLAAHGVAVKRTSRQAAPLRDKHDDLVRFALWFSPSLQRRTARDYVLLGEPVPDRLLPGRALMHVSQDTRDRVIAAANGPQPADWFVKNALALQYGDAP